MDLVSYEIWLRDVNFILADLYQSTMHMELQFKPLVNKKLSTNINKKILSFTKELFIIKKHLFCIGSNPWMVSS